MGQKTDTIKNNFTNGEISPNAIGRFDISKYSNSVKTLQNFLIKQLGGVTYRPGTKFVAAVKDSADRTRLLKFLYSTEQNYIIEAGDLYFRYYTDGGVLESGGSPVENVTVFAKANLSKIRYAQNADTIYFATGEYPVQKLTRTTATSFTISEVSFVRGPFLDTNITATTITPSADTGAGVTLTASTSIFTADHVGSLWRVKDGVVKITAFSSGTSVDGDVQAEPDGTAGDLNTGPGAVTDWAEGAWSDERGHPKVVTFHEGRLYFGHTTHQPSKVWGSVPFAYENYKSGANDDDAVNFELNADTVVAIRWLSSGPKSLDAGTTGGVFNISSGIQGQPITPSNINAPRAHIFGSADIQAQRMFNYVYYVQNDLRRFLESGYFFDIDSYDALDTTLLADHILKVNIENNIFYRGDGSSDGAIEIDSQQSPNNRIWVLRNDGQLAVLTRNVRQEVNGWSRIILGERNTCDGKSGAGQVESIAIIPQEGMPDQIWIIANRQVGSLTKRYVEYFSEEDFKYDFEPIRLDSSLSLDNPITITGVTNTDPVIVTAPSHGLASADQVKLDKIVGAHQLNGKKYEITVIDTDNFQLDSEIT